MKTDHSLAKYLLTADVIEFIAEKNKISIFDAMDLFYKSETAGLLDNDETGLYGQSALYIFSLFEEEQKNKKNIT